VSGVGCKRGGEGSADRRWKKKGARKLLGLLARKGHTNTLFSLEGKAAADYDVERGGEKGKKSWGATPWHGLKRGKTVFCVKVKERK